MKNYQYIIIVLLLSGCYVSREHRDWEKRYEKNYSDKYFYKVLNDTCPNEKLKLKLNYPYICIQPGGFYKAYIFDRNNRVFSNAWVNEKPEFGKIISTQNFIGYYKICNDTITIEKIGSWTFFNFPWKYVHNKTIGLISNDTIKLSTKSLDIEDTDRTLSNFNIYSLLKIE